MKKYILFSIILFSALWVLSPSLASAANHYIRAGATGANNGLDWTNAWHDFDHVVWGGGAGQLGAGDTLWVAGGEYNNTLQIEGSGTSGSRIYIKRARTTDAECTGASGWNASYDSQVIIQTGGTGISITGADRSYVTIDGRIDSGIYIDFPDGAAGIDWDDVAGTYFEFKYLEIVGPDKTGDGYVYSQRARGIDASPAYKSTGNMLISHCKIHGMETCVYLLDSAGTIIEYTDMYDTIVIPPSTTHENAIWGGSSDVTIRYSKFWNHGSEGIFLTNWELSGWRIYGNIFRTTHPGRASKGFQIYPDTLSGGPHYIYNNVFYDLGMGVRFGTNKSGIVRNNVFYNVGSNDFTGTTNDYNSFPSSDPFISAAGFDFNIPSSSALRNAGVALSSEYDTDMDGNIRGYDGTWDIGAYEYTGSPPPPTYCGDTSCNGTETCSTCPTDCGTCPVNLSDLIVTDISWSPASPQTGNMVTFSATIKNQGGPTPAGIIHGVLFAVDDQTYVWSDTYISSLAPGSSVTLTANGSPAGSATWMATAGAHSVLANVDDINRMAESNENNNTLTETLNVGTVDTTPPAAPSGVRVQ